MTQTHTIDTRANASLHVHSPAYRSDIDGLRAVAVLAVIVFHAFPAALPGGFTGVDIFFVISGFLITGIVIADLQAERFSIARFYARRIRRIFPALAVVLLATYAIGWFCLYATEYRELGKHILAGVGFVSNWTLWTESGYFDQAANAKPLLHLWSLGVEEQFYLVWPLLLVFTFRYRRIRSVTVMVALVSFALNVCLIRYHASAAFFLPFTRFWELLAGAALTIASQDGSWHHRMRANANAFSGLGLLLCAVSFVGLNSQLAFPGWWALLPVLGAASLIAAGSKTWLNRRLLAHPVAVWFGRISYALYLWHWPLLSLVTIIAGDTAPPAVRASVVLLSIALAWITTIAVEHPVRFGQPARWKLVAPCAAMLALGYLGGMTYARDGLGFRKGYSPDADVSTAKLGAGHEFVNPTCGVASSDQHLFQFCATDKRAMPHYAVWGDSKADSLYWGLVRVSPPGESWTLIARASCAPMAGVERVSSNAGDDPQACRDANQKALTMLLGNRDLTTVVLVMTDRDVVGPMFAYTGSGSASPSAALEGLDNAVKALQRAGKRVALVLDNPRLRDPRQCMNRRPLEWSLVRHALGVTDMSAAQRCAISYREHVVHMASFQVLIDRLRQRHADLLVYDPAAALCDAKRDVCPMTMDRHYLYSYGDHLSDYGNGLVAAQFLPLLRR